MSAKRVLLLKAGGVTPPPLLTSHGDYDRWFQRVLNPVCRLEAVKVQLGEAIPNGGEPDAVIMTGSPLSATQWEPWMERAADFMLDAAEHGVPVLGVCFGHQLLGRALGARVVRNPRGREIGTVEVQLTPDGERDPLFDGLPARAAVQATHEDVVEALPEGAALLASNELAAVQAFARGNVRGVQFHPEIDAATMGALISARREKLEAESTEPPGQRVARLLAGVRPTALAERVLVNFVEKF